MLPRSWVLLRLCVVVVVVCCVFVIVCLCGCVFVVVLLFVVPCLWLPICGCVFVVVFVGSNKRRINSPKFFSICSKLYAKYQKKFYLYETYYFWDPDVVVKETLELLHLGLLGHGPLVWSQLALIDFIELLLPKKVSVACPVAGHWCCAVGPDHCTSPSPSGDAPVHGGVELSRPESVHESAPAASLVHQSPIQQLQNWFLNPSIAPGTNPRRVASLTPLSSEQWTKVSPTFATLAFLKTSSLKVQGQWTTTSQRGAAHEN